jgi:hypothetical protein
MKYELWQVRDKKDGSVILIYAVKENIDITDCLKENHIIHNKIGEWEIKGFSDFPKFFSFDWRNGPDNRNYFIYQKNGF